jgi:ABC-2 type transport system permease protein
MRSRAVSWVLVAMTGAACGCGSSGITAPRLERALAPTFANLIQTQGTLLGLPPVDVASLRASATCHRVGPGSNPQGAGDWGCTLQWSPPGYRGTWRDHFDVSLTTDGCYTATADGEDGHLGGPRITRRDGTIVANIVYAFDGCFDPT